jgi:hypothetical protein
MAEGVSERIQLIVSGCLDTSELRNVLIGGVETVVHFVVFVLAYSRLMYVGLSFALSRWGYRKYKPPFCSSSEVSYLKFPHSFTAQAPILTAGPA